MNVLVSKKKNSHKRSPISAMFINVIFGAWLPLVSAHTIKTTTAAHSCRIINIFHSWANFDPITWNSRRKQMD